MGRRDTVCSLSDFLFISFFVLRLCFWVWAKGRDGGFFGGEDVIRLRVDR